MKPHKQAKKTKKTKKQPSLTGAIAYSPESCDALYREAAKVWEACGLGGRKIK